MRGKNKGQLLKLFKFRIYKLTRKLSPNCFFFFE